MRPEQVKGRSCQLGQRNLTTDTHPRPTQPFRPQRRTQPATRPPGMAAMCAPSLRKILPPTSQSKPEHPKLSTLGQSPVEAFVFPDYLSNPHLSEASLRTPRVSQTPTGTRAWSPRHRVPTRRPIREDTSFQDHPGTGQRRPDGCPWAWSMPAREFPGSAPALRQAIGTHQHRRPDLTETPSPPPPGS